MPEMEMDRDRDLLCSADNAARSSLMKSAASSASRLDVWTDGATIQFKVLVADSIPAVLLMITYKLLS